MAESAVSLVIENLVPLLVQKAKLLKGIHDEVESIRGELEFIRSFLKDADARAEKEDMNNVAKTWVKLVREKAYHIEDAIDKYILHFAKKSHERRQYLHFLQKVFHFTINLKPRHVIASNIQVINKKLEDIRKRGERYGFSAIEQGRSSNTGSVRWHDPRVASLFIKEAEVVGIESPRAKLIKWLVEGPSKRKVFSVVGIGGLGKTTLVKKVFDNEKVATHFDCHAWINVSQSYKMESLLRDTIKQLYKARKEFAPYEIDTMKETSLMEELSKYLRELRYLVVFDDLWDVEFWGHIKFAFPGNEKGNRIVITSRNEDVAPSRNESPNNCVYNLPPLPFEIALDLFCRKVFQCEGGKCPSDFVELSCGIVERCGGLPLAIVAIGGFLSIKDKVVSEWRKLHDSLSSELESNSRLRSIPKILSLSYHDLPYNLKACFLYFGMFPEDHSINCSRLIRLWIAEGFVKERQGTTLEEVAQDYLNQLINRSLVQLTQKDFVGKTRSCRVHDMIREVILSRSEELNFRSVSVQNCSNCKRIARRLSIQNNVNTPLESITSSQTRSILIFGVDEMPSFFSTFFANFKLMKVMDCEGAPIDYIPKEVGNLFLLRYLSLRDTKVHKLPKSIGKLHNLETLDLKRSFVSELPVEINGLHKLRYLAAYFESHDIEDNIDFRRAIKIQSGIACLQSLQKLFKIEANNDALIEELGSLGQLRKLQICKLNRENGTALCTALEKMSHLQSLKISATVEEEVLELQSMSSPPPCLQTLILSGRIEKLPEWIPKLKSIVRIGLDWSRLMDDPLKVLQTLSNLMDLLLYDGYGGEQLHIEGGGFQKLKFLGLRNLGGLNMLIIDEDALPLLEVLEIGPSPQLKKVPTGIQHLKSLKKLQFFEMPIEFVLSMQPAEGPEFWKVKHIPSVHFWNRIQGEHYKIHKLGDPELLELLQR
ncbi:disease resistance protein RPM1-like [Quercus robur]|uniref:disease resistance protein RPM1-like n=1 Tax=Quercus robur TaxID=38942 RepID=UPI002161E156|nr:disease resistance protein RPM1-like [Quercus robur]